MVIMTATAASTLGVSHCECVYMYDVFFIFDDLLHDVCKWRNEKKTKKKVTE